MIPGIPSALNSARLAESVYPYEVRTGRAQSNPGDGPNPAIYEPTGAQLIEWIDDRDSGTQVAVFRWQSPCIEIVARGTDSLQDWRANLRSRFSPAGWLRLWLEVEPAVLVAIPRGSGVCIRLSGHSLGGQLARCGALSLANQLFVRPHVVTFGAPRGCTRLQQAELEDSCSGERYESPLDPVTWLPRRIPFLGGSGARSPFDRIAVNRIATPAGRGLVPWWMSQHAIGNYVAFLSA
jgi:hypothetical protein